VVKLFLFLLSPFLIGILIGAVNQTDPTRPPKLKSTAQGTFSQPFKLTAIFVYPQYSVAIINGKPVKVGDHIDEFTVTTIRPYTVELTGPQNYKEVLPLVTPVIQNR